MTTTDNQNTFSIFTYNTKLFAGSIEYDLIENLRNALKKFHLTAFLADKLPKLSEYDEVRASEIAKKICELQPQPDIVCLQEVWGPVFRDKFTKLLGSTYPWPYVTIYPVDSDTIKDMAETAANYLNIDKLDQKLKDFAEIILGFVIKGLTVHSSITNGLVILSKTQLHDTSTTIYERSLVHDPEDRAVKKGFARCRIESPINLIFATTHAPTTPGSVDKLFLLEGHQSPARWVLAEDANNTDRIFLGDFNLHYYTDDERTNLENIMSDINPKAEDLPARITDRNLAYTDLNRDKERIDYVYFAQAANPQIKPSKIYPIDSAGKEFGPVKILDWFTEDGKMTLSDHRPVLASFDIIKK